MFQSVKFCCLLALHSELRRRTRDRAEKCWIWIRCGAALTKVTRLNPSSTDLVLEKRTIASDRLPLCVFVHTVSIAFAYFPFSLYSVRFGAPFILSPERCRKECDRRSLRRSLFWFLSSLSLFLYQNNILCERSRRASQKGKCHPKHQHHLNIDRIFYDFVEWKKKEPEDGAYPVYANSIIIIK